MAFRVASPAALDFWEERLRGLVAAHVDATDSAHARGLLEDWERTRGAFWQVVPKEMLDRLPQPLDDAEELLGEAVAAE